MITVREYTRRKPGAECCACRLPIEPGEQYREMIGIRSEAFERDYARRIAHRTCVFYLDGWEVTTEAVRATRANEALEYIRDRYKVPAFYGRPVTINVGHFAGQKGRVIGGGPHIEVRPDGSKRGGFYHPRDLGWAA